MHAWHIDEHEYARQERRRGRRHAFDRIRPERSALVVVDMVPFFVAGRWTTAAASCPTSLESASSLRAAGGTVAWVLPGPSERTALDVEFYGPEVAEIYGRAGGEGPLRERLWHELEVSDADLLVEKSAPSAFFPGRSPLPGILAERGIDTVVITGTVTNVCAGPPPARRAPWATGSSSSQTPRGAAAMRSTTPRSTRCTARSVTYVPRPRSWHWQPPSPFAAVENLITVG